MAKKNWVWATRSWKSDSLLFLGVPYRWFWNPGILAGGWEQWWDFESRGNGTAAAERKSGHHRRGDKKTVECPDVQNGTKTLSCDGSFSSSWENGAWNMLELSLISTSPVICWIRCTSEKNEQNLANRVAGERNKSQTPILDVFLWKARNSAVESEKFRAGVRTAFWHHGPGWNQTNLGRFLGYNIPEMDCLSIVLMYISS